MLLDVPNHKLDIAVSGGRRHEIRGFVSQESPGSHLGGDLDKRKHLGDIY